MLTSTQPFGQSVVFRADVSNDATMPATITTMMTTYPLHNGKTLRRFYVPAIGTRTTTAKENKYYLDSIANTPSNPVLNFVGMPAPPTPVFRGTTATTLTAAISEAAYAIQTTTANAQGTFVQIGIMNAISSTYIHPFQVDLFFDAQK